MRLFSNLLITLVGLAIGLVVTGFFLPQYQVVERQILIEAEPADIFPHVASLQAFAEWSPWADFDPDMQVTYSGPVTGIGNAMEWTSEHPNVGNGRQEIVEVIENELVLTALDFGDMGTADAWWRLEPESETVTRVTWGLNANMGQGPVGRWFGLFMDGMVGPDYERGLTRLQNSVEE
ncbi:SRPBCC family protein [Gymnodinialimonas sp. 2305UL16-5]|uniref:SRPBCC family protein n=1 Tax=Gymnodinialimonas mytili TaxID=3126503 RepID=UPI0030B7CE2C